MGVASNIRARLMPRREFEEVHDFLGVVEVDLDPELGVLVMPDHVAAMLRVDGTNFAYSSLDHRRAIVDIWAAMLNRARMSVEVFIRRQPYDWELPGNVVDELTRQVEASTPSDWQRGRLERWQEALASNEIERLQRLPVTDLRQYIVVRYPMGSAESVRSGDDSPMYLPPLRGIRFWDKMPTAFGGREGLDRWRRRRNDAIRGLRGELLKIETDLASLPGMHIERCSGIELVALLHELWRGPESHREWITDQELLDEIKHGDSVTSALAAEDRRASDTVTP